MVQNELSGGRQSASMVVAIFFPFLSDRLTHGQHHSYRIRPIPHSSMPQSQIAHHDGTLGHYGLARWPDRAAVIEVFLPDTTARSFAVSSFLNVQACVRVRSEPHLRGAILRGHGDQRNIDDIRKGVIRMVKIGI